MHEIFGYGIRNWYPHLKPADIAIWEAYILTHPDAYDTVMYDVEVGSGAPIPEGTPENIARDFSKLTKFKIDVIAKKGRKIDIIELKPSAGSAAMGQVLGYQALFRRDIDSAADTRAVVITDIIKPDIRELAKIMGVIILTP